jgi:hypothetical protein|tara:strand:+ start:339 stop:863 length:525 start_codon:yes stop_codon:yes gene_type:complete
MLETKKTKNVFRSFLSLIKPKSLSLDEELSIIDDRHYWDWECGHNDYSLPYKSMPKTMLSILKKDWSLRNKINEIYRSCIKPACQSRITWTSGGSGNMVFHSFDWKTLKQSYSYSSWLRDRYQSKYTYEKSIFDKEYKLVDSQYFDQFMEQDTPITEKTFNELSDKFWEEEYGN